MRTIALGVGLALLLTGGGCASHVQRGPEKSPERTPVAAQPLNLREVFPGVRVDAGAKVVEFDATVSPMLVPDARAPRFYLEVTCCSPDTREHETFVVTRVRPSHIHGAMLAVGLKPGEPGGFASRGRQLEAIAPRGDRIEVRFVYAVNGRDVEADPLDWVVNARDGTKFMDEERAYAAANGLGAPGWVFAGSRMVGREGRTMYDADGTGVVIGLTTFGSEMIGWSRTISPDSVVQAPEWIADFAKTPPANAPVRVRIRPAS